MRAIIFGGSGFIGSHLAASLVTHGYDVTVADLLEPDYNLANVEYVPCDVRKSIDVSRDVPFDAVYNLAAVHRTPGHEPWEYYDTNIAGAQNISDWCDAGGERLLFFTSSIAAYGPSEDPKSETSPDEPNSDYGRSKLFAERIHRRWQEVGPGRRLIIVRPAVVFGPAENGNFTRLAKALAKRRFMYAGRSDVIKSCGYVGDLVASLAFMESQGLPYIMYNYCYPTGYTIGEICDAFGKVAGYRTPRTMPRPILTVIMRVLKAINPNDRGTLSRARVAKLTASTNIKPATLVQMGFEWPTDLEGGLHAWLTASANSEFR